MEKPKINRNDEILFSEFNPEYIRREQEKKRMLELKARRHKLIMTILKVSIGVLVIFGIYLFSSLSKIRDITITGNPYLTEDYLMKLAGINYDTRVPFIFPSYISSKLNSNPLIESSEVMVDSNRLVRIDLTMKKALAYYFEGNDPFIVLEDGSEIKLENNLYSTLASIPMLRNFRTDVQRTDLIQELKKIKSDIIAGISEIWGFTETYDPNMYRFIMNDGNQVFVSKAGIKYMASYYGIAANVSNPRSCLMINEDTNSAYTRSCQELNDEEARAIAQLFPNEVVIETLPVEETPNEAEIQEEIPIEEPVEQEYYEEPISQEGEQEEYYQEPINEENQEEYSEDSGEYSEDSGE